VTHLSSLKWGYEPVEGISRIKDAVATGYFLQAEVRSKAKTEDETTVVSKIWGKKRNAK
jgi:hypothetical protein